MFRTSACNIPVLPRTKRKVSELSQALTGYEPASLHSAARFGMEKQFGTKKFVLLSRGVLFLALVSIVLLGPSAFLRRSGRYFVCGFLGNLMSILVDPSHLFFVASLHSKMSTCQLLSWRSVAKPEGCARCSFVLARLRARWPAAAGLSSLLARRRRVSASSVSGLPNCS